MIIMANGSFDLSRSLGSTLAYSRCNWSSSSSTENNNSTVNVNVVFGKYSNSTKPTTCTFNTTVSVSGANNPSTQYSSPYTSVYGGQEIVVFSGSFIVPHNDDGTMSTTISVSIGNNDVYHASASSTVTLDTIARKTPVPSFSAGYVEDTYNLVLVPKFSSAKHSIKFRFGNTKGEAIGENALTNWLQADGSLGTKEVKLSGTNLPVTFPIEYYDHFDGDTGYGALNIYTYKGDTEIGMDGNWFKISCNPSRCTPKVEATVEDMNPITLELTGDKNTVVTNASRMLITPTIQVSDEDDKNSYISSKKVNGNVFTGETAIVNEPTSKVFSLSVTNSRNLGIDKTIEASGNLIPYVKPTFNIEGLYRPEPTGSEIVLSYSGKFYTGEFREGVVNELTLTWKYKSNREEEYQLGGTLTPTINTSQNTYEGIVTLGDEFDYQTGYDFQFYYKDKIVGINDDIYVRDRVTKGLPMFWWNEKGLRVLTDLYVNGNLILSNGDIQTGGGGGDSLPVGSIFEYDGNSVPDGYDEVYDNSEYALEEKRIGTWIDGKPLYRRCFKGITYASSSTTITTELGGENCSIKNVGGFLTEGNNPKLHINIGGYINSDWYCGFYTAETALVLYHPTNLGGGAYELFIEYTKNSD